MVPPFFQPGLEQAIGPIRHDFDPLHDASKTDMPMTFVKYISQDTSSGHVIHTSLSDLLIRLRIFLSFFFLFFLNQMKLYIFLKLVNGLADAGSELPSFITDLNVRQ